MDFLQYPTHQNPKRRPGTGRRTIQRPTFSNSIVGLASLLLTMVVPAGQAFAQVSVKTATATTQKNLVQEITKPASAYANKTADLFAKIGGYVEKINVDIGDQVEKDQVLAVLKVPEMKSQKMQREALLSKAKREWDQAKAAETQAELKIKAAEALESEANAFLRQKKAKLDLAKTEWKRIDQLVRGGSINQELLDSANFQLQIAESDITTGDAKIKTAQANLASAEAELLKAQADALSAKASIDVADANLNFVVKMLEYAEIKAPFKGRVTKRFFDEGAFVQSADGNSAAKSIFQIVELDTIRIVFSLSSTEIQNLNVGDPVVFRSSREDALGEFSGKISRFSGGLDAETRMLRVEVDLENSARKLLPGHFGSVSITMTTVDSAIVIPAKCLDGNRVFFANNGKAEAHTVEIAYANKDIAVIKSGISAGQKVIISPRNLKSGDAIEE